jgi:hypothetical protein
MGEQIELVTPGQPGERRQALGDEYDSFLRTAIGNQIIRSWPPVPTGRPTPHITQWLFQTGASKLANWK